MINRIFIYFIIINFIVKNIVVKIFTNNHKNGL